MKILKTVQRFPGGLMVGPMMLAAVLNTWMPGFSRIGGPTTALFSSAGTLCLSGLLLFIVGSQLRVQQIGAVLRRHGVLLVIKLAVAWGASVLLMRSVGAQGLLGISAMALVVALSSNNPGVYLVLTKTYGDEVDQAAFGIWNLACMPTIPVLILGMAGGAAFDYMALISLLIPFLLGVLLGNLDLDIRAMMAPGSLIMLPFLGFCFGMSVNLMTAFRSGLQGLLLTAIFLVATLLPALAADRLLLRRPGYGAVATCCVAGLAVGAPAQVALVVAEHAPFVEAATAQIALAVIVTTILTPILTKAAVSIWGNGRAADSAPSPVPAAQSQ